MMTAIRNDETPNFYFMQYELTSWSIKNLLLVPHFVFPPSAIIKRKPLAVTARRAGWIGCNLALSRIPADAPIAVVTESRALPDSEVRAQFRRLKPLGEIKAQERGWTLDVLNIVRRLVESRRRGDEALNKESSGRPESLSLLTSSPTTEFTNEDVYAFTRELEELHPGNRHVKDKIRQQLQVLRDAGLLLHVERGCWRLR